jgi:transcriptional regulator with XRE-family HTH domain
MKTRLILKNKAGVQLPPVNDVPILIPDTALAAIKGTEETPYEMVEAIEFPSEGQGGIYTGSYFESLLTQMKTRPLGGSKTGHDNTKDDFFTIGGRVEHTAENAGVAYFRILVPAEGYETTNSGFIRSCKTGNQEFSIVANAEPTRGNDGKVYITEDIGKARNDAVPSGAMEQTVSNSAEEKEIMDLISAGMVDYDTDSTELLVNGRVCRRAAAKLIGTNGKLADRILNAIKKNRKENTSVTKEEIIAAAKAAISNNQLTLEELAQALSMENKLHNATDEQRAALAKAIAEALELPPDTPAEELIKAATEALKEAAEATEAVVENEANSIAGGAKLKNADGTEVDNPAFVYAKNQLAGKRGKTLKNAAEALKKDLVMISLRSKQADPRTPITNAGGVTAGTMRRV